MLIIFRLFILLYFYLLYTIKKIIFFCFIFNNNYYKQKKAILFVNLLQSGGPIFIKLGQLLTTRIDIFDEIYIKELVKLQDKAKVIHNKKIFKIFKKHFNENIDSVFSDINLKTISSASIAQVYEASYNSKKVAIKIIKPFVEQQYKADIKILYLLAFLLEKLSKIGKITKPTSIIKTLEHNLQFELDLRFEAASMEKSKEFFEKQNATKDIIYIPQVNWDYVSKNVLVSEFIVGAKINNVDFLKQHNIQKEQLVKNLLTIFFYQALKNGHFHGDMHAGNILVKENGVIVLIDFGIMDFCSDEMKFYLKELFLAFLNNDYKKVADIHFDIGWIEPSHNRLDFELSARIIMKKILNKNQKDIKLGEFLKQLFVISQIFKMKIQPSLLNLQKNLVYIENISRYLLEDKNVWILSKDVLEQINAESSNLYSNTKQDYLFKLDKAKSKVKNTINDIVNYYKYNINQNNAIILQTRIRNILFIIFIVIIIVYFNK